MIGYRRDIDGLRAVAVSAVILFHAKVPLFGGGFVGVDIFFVISGYLITNLILADIDRDRFSLAEFYTRRIRRIFPALFLVVAATALVGWAVLTPLDLKLLGESIFATATFSSNILFWHSSGYFEPPLSQWPLLHTWSLSLEEQYYAVFPVLLLLLTFAVPRRRTLLIFAIAAASFLIGVLVTGPYPRAAFFLAPSRIWEFLVGALLAMGAVPQIKKPLHRDLVGLSGAALIAVAIFEFSAATTFPGMLAVLPVFGTAALIWAGEQGETQCRRVLSMPPLVGIGKTSYSLYLWHFPILAFAAYLSVGGITAAETSLLIALTFVLSFVSWKFVEQPVRKRRWIFRGRFAVLSFAVLVTGAAGAFGLSAYIKAGFPGRFDAVTNQILAAESDLDKDESECGLDLDQKKSGAFCQVGEDSAAPSFLLWGDSHAAMLRPAIAATAARHGVSGVMATYGGCIPASGIERADLGVCDAVNRAVLQHLLASPSLKTVILVGRWALWTEGSRYKLEQRLPKKIVVSSSNGTPGRGNRAAVEQGLETLVSRLKAAGKDVWLVGPVPEIGYPVPRALYLARLDSRLAADVRPSSSEFTGRQVFVLKLLEKLQSTYGVHVIWPHRELCDSDYCHVARDGLPLYADDGHLTSLGAQLVSKRFDAVFEH